MQTIRTLRSLAALSFIALTALAASQAHAQATIDQNKALAGNITPGDAAGFPITISQPGSYKLMSNLYVPAGSNGIDITASDVSLDLNGFSIIGPMKCSRNTSTYAVSCQGGTTGATGVNVSLAASNTSVRNGGVTGFSYAGLYFQGSSNSNNGSVENLRITHNYFGVVGACRVHNSQAMLNGSSGFSTLDAGCLFTSSISRQNGLHGFDGYAMVQQSNTSQNYGHGYYGLVVRESRAKDNKSGAFANGTSMGGNMFDNTVD